MTVPVTRPGIDILHELGTGTMERRLYCLFVCDASATGSTMQCQREHDIVDPPSIIKLFQEHPSDITLMDTAEVIRMQEAVALFTRLSCRRRHRPRSAGAPAFAAMP